MAARRSFLSSVILSVFFLSGLATPANAGNSADHPQPIDLVGDETERPTESFRGAGIESLALPLVNEEMSRLASDLTKNLADHPQFASSEVTANRDRVVVHWHGKESAELAGIISGHKTVPTEVRQTKFLPGELRQRIARLGKADIDLASYSVNHDGSGFRISVSQSAENRKSPAEIARHYEAELQAPVAVSEASPEPANSYTRQFDNSWHLGGARIYSWTNGTYNGACTSGFTVRQNITGNEGTMFAAHCARLGTEWSAWDDGPYYFPWGNVTANDYYHDGSIIHSGTSYGFIWTSTWDSDVYTQINGDAYAYVGQEICYSGSYSGLSCGNIVKNTAETYQFEGYPHKLQGSGPRTSAPNRPQGTVIAAARVTNW